MAEARRRAPELSGPTWILADRQTASHGRRGRNWSSLEGNFFGTLVIRPDCSPAEAAQRSFVAAIALYFALSEWIDASRLALKWPNDVLLRQRKVAGILLESSSKGAKVDWLAIGIGVNLLSAPRLGDLEDRALPPISVVGGGGATVSNTEFLTALARNFDHWDQQLRDYGFEPVREMWLRHAAKLGKVITARTTNESYTGAFQTVDVDGNLVLKTDAGLRAIAAADVYF